MKKKNIPPTGDDVFSFKSHVPSVDFSFPPPKAQSAGEHALQAVTCSLADLEQVPSTGPLLDLTDEQGQERQFAHLHVTAAMLYPRDAPARHEYLAGMIADRVDKALRAQPEYTSYDPEQLGATFGEQLAPYGGIPALIHARSLNDIEEKSRKMSWRGCLAGQLLTTIVQHAQVGLPASVNKAVQSLVHDNQWMESQAQTLADEER